MRRLYVLIVICIGGSSVWGGGQVGWLGEGCNKQTMDRIGNEGLARDGKGIISARVGHVVVEDDGHCIH